MRPVIFENKNNFFNTLSRLLILFDSVLILENVLLHSAEVLFSEKVLPNERGPVFLPNYSNKKGHFFVS